MTKQTNFDRYLQDQLRDPDFAARFKKAGEALAGDFVSLLINSKELQLLPQQALQVGGAILRKFEDADDYQLNRG